MQVDIGDADPLLGEPLEIRLINLNIPGTPEAPGIEVNFDAVSLTAEPLVGSDCPGDLNNDNRVDADDLAILIGAFASSPAGDLNDDGETDADDLAILLAAFGTSC